MSEGNAGRGITTMNPEYDSKTKVWNPQMPSASEIYLKRETATGDGQTFKPLSIKKKEGWEGREICLNG